MISSHHCNTNQTLRTWRWAMANLINKSLLVVTKSLKRHLVVMLADQRNLMLLKQVFTKHPKPLLLPSLTKKRRRNSNRINMSTVRLPNQNLSKNCAEKWWTSPRKFIRVPDVRPRPASMRKISNRWKWKTSSVCKWQRKKSVQSRTRKQLSKKIDWKILMMTSKQSKLSWADHPKRMLTKALMNQPNHLLPSSPRVLNSILTNNRSQNSVSWIQLKSREMLSTKGRKRD